MLKINKNQQIPCTTGLRVNRNTQWKLVHLQYVKTGNRENYELHHSGKMT